MNKQRNIKQQYISLYCTVCKKVMRYYIKEDNGDLICDKNEVTGDEGCHVSMQESRKISLLNKDVYPKPKGYYPGDKEQRSAVFIKTKNRSIIV